MLMVFFFWTSNAYCRARAMCWREIEKNLKRKLRNQSTPSRPIQRAVREDVRVSNGVPVACVTMLAELKQNNEQRR
ncbi:hypothetical protein BD289DRAFT_240597 [Coniella lustricola]|uniref:Secreted protein n=1 Tax=Coniella lustricola TaxID=2025994 RepID=A0A2T3ALD3_9PEZI|nr:hypothetical protein BD289DRAFT_240597 [Coniella lustricola]